MKYASVGVFLVDVSTYTLLQFFSASISRVYSSHFSFFFFSPILLTRISMDHCFFLPRHVCALFGAFCLLRLSLGRRSQDYKLEMGRWAGLGNSFRTTPSVLHAAANVRDDIAVCLVDIVDGDLCPRYIRTVLGGQRWLAE